MNNDHYHFIVQLESHKHVVDFDEADLLKARACVIVDAIGGAITFDEAETVIDLMDATVMSVRAERKREAA